MLRLLWAAVWLHRRRTLGALFLVLLAKGAVVVPLALKGIIDELGRVPPSVLLAVVLVLGYALLRFPDSFFSEVRDVLFARVTQHTVSTFLLKVFAHLHRLSTRFHAVARPAGVRHHAGRRRGRLRGHPATAPLRGAARIRPRRSPSTPMTAASTACAPCAPASRHSW